jgi:hypothetical protein
MGSSIVGVEPAEVGDAVFNGELAAHDSDSALL